MSLVHTTRKITPLNQMYYRSDNHIHSLNELYSLLFKSLRSGDEMHALYSIQHIPYNNLIKKILILFLCENCPNLYVIRELYITRPDQIDFKTTVIRICRMVKTRIVINAFRVVSFDEYKENNYSINSIYIINCTPEEQQIEPTTIPISQEKALVKNGYVIWSLLCKHGVKQTMDEILHLYHSISPIDAKPLLYKLYKYLDKRYLDIIFVFLAFISIPGFSLNRQQQRVPADISSDLVVPSVIKPLPEYIYDLFSASKKANRRISYYFDNMKLSPTTKPTMTDKYGIMKFIQINEPLESSINELIKCKTIENIHIARFANERYSLASTHATHIKYKYIITRRQIQTKAEAQHYIFSEALKQDLGLRTLNRHIISHKSKYYIIQNNFLPVDDPDNFIKNDKRQTMYTHAIDSIYPEHMEFYVDDAPLVIKLLTCIMYRKIIGYPIYRKYSMIIYNGEIYMLDDNLNKFYSKTITCPTLSTQLEVVMKQQVTIHWKVIHKTLKRWFKIISSNKFININQRVRMLHEITRLQDFKNWKFSSLA